MEQSQYEHGALVSVRLKPHTSDNSMGCVNGYQCIGGTTEQRGSRIRAGHSLIDCNPKIDLGSGSEKMLASDHYHIFFLGLTL